MTDRSSDPAPAAALRRIGLALTVVWALVLVVTAVEAWANDRTLFAFALNTMSASWWYLGAAVVAYTAGVHLGFRADPAARPRTRPVPRLTWPGGSQVAIAVIVVAALGLAVAVLR